jgi:hypothetical protein
MIEEKSDNLSKDRFRSRGIFSIIAWSRATPGVAGPLSTMECTAVSTNDDLEKQGIETTSSERITEFDFLSGS